MAISDKYEFMLPCDETSGTVAADASGNGNDCEEESGNTDGLFINPGFITSMINTALGGGDIPLTTNVIPFDPWVGDSFIWMGILKQTVDTGADVFSGNNRLNANNGFAILQQTSGRLALDIRGGVQSNDTTNVLSRAIASDSKEHHFAICIDGPTRTASILIDGVMGDAGSGGALINSGGVGIHFTKSMTASLQESGQPFSWGSAGGRNNSAQNFASQWYGLHFLRYPNQNLPANVFDIVQAAIANPRTPLDSSIAG